MKQCQLQSRTKSVLIPHAFASIHLFRGSVTNMSFSLAPVTLAFRRGAHLCGEITKRNSLNQINMLRLIPFDPSSRTRENVGPMAPHFEIHTGDEDWTATPPVWWNVTKNVVFQDLIRLWNYSQWLLFQLALQLYSLLIPLLLQSSVVQILPLTVRCYRSKHLSKGSVELHQR